MEGSLIDRLKADHKARTTRVEILGVAVYVAPLTVAESTQVNVKHPNDAAQRQAELLVQKCRDESGKPIFGAGDKPALMREVAGDRFGEVFRLLNGLSLEAQQEK